MRISTVFRRRLAAALSLAIVGSGAAMAQEAETEPSIGLELNSLDATQAGCRMTFVVANDLGTAVSKIAYEVALFDENGLVDRLTVLDFQSLPQGKTKVRQFDVPGTDCAKIGRVLINDATACEGQGLEPTDCIRKLKTAAKSGTDFGS